MARTRSYSRITRPAADLPKTVFTVREAAHYLAVHPATIYRLIKDGTFPAFRIGTSWRFNKDSVDRWIRERENQACAVPARLAIQPPVRSTNHPAPRATRATRATHSSRATQRRRA